MFFTYILRIAAILGALQTAIVWLGRMIRMLGQTIVMLQTAYSRKMKRLAVRA